MPALLPPPRREDLRAARERLIPRHGTAVEQILWDNQTTRPSDAELIRRVVDGSGSPDATDLAAALLLLAAAHRDLDLLELALCEKVLATGLTWEGIASVLGLPDARTAEDRYHTLRRFQQQAGDTGASLLPPSEPAGERI